ncbi:MAG: Aldehyde-alcohol dehydrogenase [Chloroflexi bacterium ADurb.Bin180]|nr:MAG: Aldehyde-alcohol dehydrogenase [Chloroflexi bacterium ADurb.Bin180]HOU24157.1 iron-containing alcohol dehydrogenase [Anaerolineae bacterium]HQJ50321.1 iron-containing alcohol dehydrogenase [Anaerolineae bacterium]
MWYFNSPLVVFGEDALNELVAIQGHRAFVVTDSTLLKLGHVDRVTARLKEAGLEVRVFAEVEPDPSLETVKRGAAQMADFGPDWIVGLGGGSCMDAAKAMWVLYEHPEMVPEEINPVVPLVLRQKARLITIPTTSGTGAEATWAIILTDTAENRKLALGSRENMADIAIVDPVFVAALPPQVTADTGMDVLTHAVEGYTTSWHNDFCDGLCLKAIQLVMDYLPRAVLVGTDPEARERMHNAATIAGLGFGNALAAMAHAMGHSLGAVFHTPHGRAVGLVLPYTVEFTGLTAPDRYADIVRFLGLGGSVADAPRLLAERIRSLAREIRQPLSLQDAGITRTQFEAALPKLVQNAENDATLVASARIPDSGELSRLYACVMEGRAVDF